MTSFSRIETEYDAGQNLESMRSYSQWKHEGWGNLYDKKGNILNGTSINGPSDSTK